MALCLEVHTGALLLGAVLLLILPLNWMLGALFAAGFHELCHILAILLTGGCVHAIRIGIQGAVIHTSPMERRQELLCAVAGPAGSLLLWILYPVMPRLALCGLIHGLFNLIPVYPLDGGRALFCVLCGLFDEETLGKIQFAVCMIFGAGMFFLGILCSFRMGIAPVVWVAYLLFRAFWKNSLQTKQSRSTIMLPKKMR